MKVLQILEGAYRATIEEQDDPAIWITHAMRAAGGEFSLLLRGNAVSYASRRQDASGLSFGIWLQRAPPQPGQDLVRLVAAGVPVHVLAEDLELRGISSESLIAEAEIIRRRSLSEFMDRFDRIWHW